MIIEAITKIKSDAVVSIKGSNIDTCEITWHDGNPTNITKEQIQAKIDETAYINNREKEYPSWQDQMDMQYWDKINNTSTWQDAVQAVKDKYPKS